MATLLNYGEPQILELFFKKNTLPSRLYYMVYNINNLREAVETAKCMLMKEQIDGHKSGQATSSPLMKVNHQNSKKKGITFNAMETIQKQGDSIDKLTSLMNELSSKLDRKDNSSQYKPRIHPGRSRGCGQRQNRYICLCRFLILFDILYIKVSLKQNSYFLLRDKLSPGTNPGFLKSEKMLCFIYLYTPRCIRKYLCSLF